MTRNIVNHPEEYCHRCLGPNLSWYIDNAVWKRHLGAAHHPLDDAEAAKYREDRRSK